MEIRFVSNKGPQNYNCVKVWIQIVFAGIQTFDKESSLLNICVSSNLGNGLYFSNKTNMDLIISLICKTVTMIKSIMDILISVWTLLRN